MHLHVAPPATAPAAATVASQHGAAHGRRDLAAVALPPALGIEVNDFGATAESLGRGEAERHRTGIGFELGTS